MAEAVRLVEAHRHTAMNQERWPDLQRWLSRLPRQVIDAHPGLVLAEAWLLHRRAARADLPERLARAEALLQQMPLGEDARLRLQGEIDAFTVQLIYWTAEAERTLALAQRALAVTPIEHSYVRALARLFEAGALQMRGDISGAIETLDEGLREDRVRQPHLFTPFAGLVLLPLLGGRRPSATPQNGSASARVGARAQSSGKPGLGALLPGLRPLSAERPGSRRPRFRGRRVGARGRPRLRLPP